MKNSMRNHILYTFPINSRNFEKVLGLELGLVLVSTDSLALAP